MEKVGHLELQVHLKKSCCTCVHCEKYHLEVYSPLCSQPSWMWKEGQNYWNIAIKDCLKGEKRTPVTFQPSASSSADTGYSSVRRSRRTPLLTQWQKSTTTDEQNVWQNHKPSGRIFCGQGTKVNNIKALFTETSTVPTVKHCGGSLVPTDSPHPLWLT